MSKKKNQGKIFEEDIRNSSVSDNIFFYRIKDVSPMMLKKGARVAKNDFDSFIYKKPSLFPVELKSTKAKSISFEESMIKGHQIKSLDEASEYEGIIPGFIFNFRFPKNRAFFVHIDDFLLYKDIAENKKEHTYESRVNQASIPIGICEEIGIEIRNEKKRTRYRYFINELLDELIEKY